VCLVARDPQGVTLNLRGEATDDAEDECLFCRRIRLSEELLAERSACVALHDATPLNPGHVLILPRRHEPDMLALSSDELSSIMGLTQEIRGRLDQKYHPDGYNLGVNIGTAGGQTIGHAHLHLVPRYLGDVAEVKGGIRWIIPKRARYWVDED
jgi:ATP adenylyltransferase